MTVLLASVLATAALAAPAADKILTVAVYDFTDTDKGPPGYGAKITALVTADLTTETNLTMVERSDLKKAIGEQAIGLSGIVSADTAAKIGQVTGAKVLVSGQIIKTNPKHLVVLANIIGTESGRLFATKVEGATDNLMNLTAELSQKIGQTIREQSTNFFAVARSHDEVIDGILKSVTGTNRPAVSVSLHFPRGPGYLSATVNGEMAMILQKAGFVVVDSKSERKPDIEISGVVDIGNGVRRGSLHSCRVTVDAKVQERHTGNIIGVERVVGDAVQDSQAAAGRLAQANAADALAEKIVPLLAK